MRLRRRQGVLLIACAGVALLAGPACSEQGSTSPRADVASLTPAALGTASGQAPAAEPAPAGSTANPAPNSAPGPGPAANSGSAPAPNVPTSQRRLRLVKTVDVPHLSSKSVVASGTGLFFAQNMMYEHTISVFDGTGALVRTIPDSVDLAKFGVSAHPGISRGAPVEAAFSPDRRFAYVSNYSMYGAGFGPEGQDSCSPSSGYSDSYLYRIDVSTLAVDQVIRVGAVPKYVATSPDGKLVLVSDWCSYALSVVDTGSAREIKRIPLGPYARGIAVTPDSGTAYVAVMGDTRIAAVNLRTYAVGWINGVGSGPRHLVLDPAGRYLYVTLNGEGDVAKVDLRTGLVVARVATGQAPRSMAISADGQSLYVVNYSSGTMSKVNAATMQVVQTVDTGYHPIGVTYDPQSGNVWVANYSGTLMIFAEDPSAGADRSATP
ncbi:MAG: YncE family protein [Frankiaceae bacterium]